LKGDKADISYDYTYVNGQYSAETNDLRAFASCLGTLLIG